MKPQQQHKSGAVDKKQSKQPEHVVLLPAPPDIVVEHRSAFGSPSTAVWNRYIDSRMKQFGTR